LRRQVLFMGLLKALINASIAVSIHSFWLGLCGPKAEVGSRLAEIAYPAERLKTLCFTECFVDVPR
jgi:hypothetical protein